MSRKGDWLRAKPSRERAARVARENEKGVTYTADDERGYEAVFNAKTGSIVKVHYPELRTDERIPRLIPAHDELYEVKQDTPTRWESDTLRLAFRGSSSPNSKYETVNPIVSYRGINTNRVQGVRSALRGVDQITIIPPGTDYWLEYKYAVNWKKVSASERAPWEED